MGWVQLEEINQDSMFELKDMRAAWLWMSPPAAMEVAVELPWEDRLAVEERFRKGHRHTVHHTSRSPILGAPQFELLIVAIVSSRRTQKMDFHLQNAGLPHPRSSGVRHGVTREMGQDQASHL